MARPPGTAPENTTVLSASLEYATRRSAALQAERWNHVLRDDPEFGPDSGFIVDVGPESAGRWPLVWRRRTPSERGKSSSS
jgi:hypothetical protein